MKVRYRVEADEWTTRGSKITSVENIETIRQVVEKAPIIVEHWFLRASSSPARLVFDDFDDFTNYLDAKALAGDAIYVWDFTELCRNENTVAQGKCPADDGCIPQKGAY